MLIDILLVKSNEGLSNALSNGVNL
eukprot:Gb_29924 [translate_table: standard]